MTGQPPIYVINMQRDVARWQSMATQLDALGLKAERVEAVDGRVMTDAQRKAVYADFWFRLFHGRSATNSEIGCALSHRKIWQMMVERGEKFAIIFEDDALLLPTLARDLTEIERETRSFDMVHLYAFRAPQKLQHKAASGAFDVMTYRGPHGSTAAYGLRLSGATKLLSITKIRAAADKWTWASAMTGLKCCGINPYVVGLNEPHSAVSTIGASSRNTSGIWRVVVLPALRVARGVILRMRGV
jgi:glycosyl transferase, family 25